MEVADDLKRTNFNRNNVKTADRFLAKFDYTRNR